ncbi:MAG: hypothetical protein QOD72_1820, partial [Acidimicrobiaceae bacterium]|nr:hypothetical protein [Acidimicrobiaceae bacterium]
VGVYCVAPYIALWVVVRCWPNGHPHRDEYLAEYRAIPIWRRPIWVADVAIHSVCDGLAERHSQRVALGRRLKSDRRFLWFIRGVVVFGAIYCPTAFVYQAMRLIDPNRRSVLEIASPVVIGVLVVPLFCCSRRLWRRVNELMKTV